MTWPEKYFEHAFYVGQSWIRKLLFLLGMDIREKELISVKMNFSKFVNNRVLEKLSLTDVTFIITFYFL